MELRMPDPRRIRRERESSSSSSSASSESSSHSSPVRRVSVPTGDNKKPAKSVPLYVPTQSKVRPDHEVIVKKQEDRIAELQEEVRNLKKQLAKSRNNERSFGTRTEDYEIMRLKRRVAQLEAENRELRDGSEGREGRKGAPDIPDAAKEKYWAQQRAHHRSSSNGPVKEKHSKSKKDQKERQPTYIEGPSSSHSSSSVVGHRARAPEHVYIEGPEYGIPYNTAQSSPYHSYVSRVYYDDVVESQPYFAPRSPVYVGDSETF